MKRNLIETNNNNPTQKKQKELHFIAKLFNVLMEVTGGLSKMRPNKKSAFGKTSVKGKAFIDANDKTVKVHTDKGILPVSDDTVDWGFLDEALPKQKKKIN